MKMTRRSLAATALVAAARPAMSQAQEPALAVRDESGPGPMDQILLKDYQPESSLVVPVTNVPKAKHQAIDVHCHPFFFVNKPAQVTQWIRTMDEVGIELTVVLSGATGERFDQWAGLFAKAHPKRLQMFCGIDTQYPDAPDYPKRAAAELERCFRMGARGVGEVSDKGSGITRGPLLPRDRRLHVDDARLDPFWDKCAELRMPVNLHIADHPSCWRPLDAKQERSSRYQRFNLYGKDVPSHAELMAKRDHLLRKHPKTTLIACHLSNQGHDLATLAKALDRFPNLYLDISARAYEVGRQPRAAAKFLMKYKDRVLFGTDQGLDKGTYRPWWRLFETADEYITGPNSWRLYGLDLPDPVLDALYRGNAKRLLNWNA